MFARIFADADRGRCSARILTAAHHAGSVGLMQPWDFVVIRQRATKRAVKQLFKKTNAQAAVRYEDARATLYRSLKLEGTRESADQYLRDL